MEIKPEDFRLSDALLVSIAWNPTGADLNLHFILGGGKGRVFHFTWVSDLRIALNQAKGASRPLTFHTTAANNLPSRLNLIVDFASQGEISFQCEAILEDDV